MQEQPDHFYQDYAQLKANKMTFKVKPEAIELTHKPKYLYPYLNVFELEYNRLSTLEEYRLLAAQIQSFNQELKAWKTNDIPVCNLFLSYHLYENLFSRMKYTSNLIFDREEARKSYLKIAEWFFVQKPKIRNKAPEKEEGKLKSSLTDRQTEDIDSMVVGNATKRELKVYESMCRTTHKQFFPPKQRLLEYKRKDLLQGFAKESTEELPKRAMSVNSLGSRMKKYRGSFASTRTSLIKTTAERKRDQEIIEPVVVPFQVQEQKDEKEKPQEPIGGDMQVEDNEKQKIVLQEELMKDTIIQPLNEEDQPDAEDELSEEPEKQDPKKYKKYKLDPDADEEMLAEQRIKDIKQSTLRRILKQKEESIRNKMEELDLAKQMANWASIKGRRTAEDHSRAERKTLVNRYNDLKYTPKTFEQRRSSRVRDIPEYPMLYRSKSSHPATMEKEVEKLRIGAAIKTYGKYINHVDVKPIQLNSEESKEQMRKMRSTSLTSFGRQGKKAPFSAFLEKHGALKFNQDAEDDIQKTKDCLSKRGVAVEKQQLMRAARVPELVEIGTNLQVFPPQKVLFSNPFFPKHLFASKGKKKKK